MISLCIQCIGEICKWVIDDQFVVKIKIVCKKNSKGNDRSKRNIILNESNYGTCRQKKERLKRSMNLTVYLECHG